MKRKQLRLGSLKMLFTTLVTAVSLQFATAQSYCIPVFTTGCTSGDNIEDFILGAGGSVINHLGTGCSPNAYGDFTSIVGNVQPGQTYPFTATHNFSSQRVSIWVDLNNDFVFDSSEQLYASPAGANPTVGDITIPATAQPGLFRMRVMTRFSVPPVDACNPGGAWGETHDYTLQIDGTPCVEPPVAGAAQSNLSEVCAGQNFVLTLTGINFFSGQTYQWQSSPNNIDWNDIPGATGISLSTSQTSTTFYRNMVTCGATSVPSTPVQVITNVAPMSGTYIINQNSPAADYQSISQAVQDLACRGVNGPVLLEVATGSGPYNEQVLFTNISGASATNTITLEGNNNSIVFTPPTSDDRYGIRFNGASHITVNRLNIDLSAATLNAFGIHLTNGSEFINIQNCEIDINANVTSITVAGIVSSSSNTSATTLGNSSNNVKIVNNTIRGGYYGIAFTGNGNISQLEGIEILDNIIEDSYFYGIYINSNNGTIIKGNEISRATRTTLTTYHGIGIVGAGSRNVVIDGNRIFNTSGGNTANASANYGISITTANPIAGEENIIQNNKIYNLNNNGIQYGIFLSTSADNVKIYHNTIVLNDQNATTASATRAIHTASLINNLDIRNNIFEISRTGTGNKHAIWHTNAGTIFQSNHNIFNILSTQGNNGVVNVGSTSFATLADWQAASPTNDPNSLVADPFFVDPAGGNFTPLSGLIDNLGTPVGVQFDFFGNTRSASTPDIGAVEFVPPGNDAGITAVLEPSLPSCSFGNNLVVQLTNFGNDTLTSVTIHTQLNGFDLPPVNWTGSLPTGASTPVTIGNFTFNDGDIITSWTTNPNNEPEIPLTNVNDTVSVMLKEAFAGTYTLGGTNPDFTNFNDLADQLTQFGVCDSVIINVANGTYNEQVIFTAVPGADSNNRITIKSASGNASDVIIQATNTTMNNFVIHLSGASFFTFEKLSILSNGPAVTCTAVLIDGGSEHNVFRNNFIRSDSTTTSTLASASLIRSENGNDHFNTFEGNILNGGSKAFHYYGENQLFAEEGTVIRNNTLLNQRSAGIELRFHENVVIEGNSVDPQMAATGLFYGIRLWDSKGSNTIISNRLQQLFTTGAPIYMQNVFGVASAPSLVANNFLTAGSPASSIVTRGIWNQGSSHINYVHNSIYHQSNATTSSALHIDGGFGINIWNNNIVADGQGYALNILTPGSAVSDYNNLFTSGGPLALTGGGQVNTLAGWQNFSGLDQNSVSVNPQFPSQVDLTTCVEELDGNAFPLNFSGLEFDLFGIQRSAVRPDIGASEFIGSNRMLGDDFNICQNDEFVLSVPFIDGTTYTWSPVQSSENSITVTQAGTYSVSVNSSCGTFADTITIGLDPLPIASFDVTTSFLTAIFINSSMGANTFTWDFGDGNNSNDINPIHVYNASGIYTVTLTAFNECGEVSVSKDVEIVILSLEESISELVKIFPNPVSDATLWVDFGTLSSTELVMIDVVDLQGRVLASQRVNINENSRNAVDISTLTPGYYFIRVVVDNTPVNFKFIKL